MKNIFVLLIVLTIIGCKSRRDSRIEAAMKGGYSYEAACEACDDSSNDKMSR